MKELYSIILFDDGRAPKHFEKDHLCVDRADINKLLNKEIKISSRNLRNMEGAMIGKTKKD